MKRLWAKSANGRRRDDLPGEEEDEDEEEDVDEKCNVRMWTVRLVMMMNDDDEDEDEEDEHHEEGKGGFE